MNLNTNLDEAPMYVPIFVYNKQGEYRLAMKNKDGKFMFGNEVDGENFIVVGWRPFLDFNS